MPEFIELNPAYSTTRRVRKVAPEVVESELKAAQKSEDQFETILFQPEGEGRKGEGGLRTKGYFKKSSDDKPLITVITVVFNGEKHLEETILSVINQTYDNVEYIVIDGGSTDGTLDIVRKYEHAIDYWISEKDKGIYDAMQKGVDICHGCYLNFMNSGDLLNLSTAMVVAHTISVGVGNSIIYGRNKWLDHKSPGLPYGAKFYPFLGRLPSHQAMFIPTSIQRCLGFDRSLKLYADQDFKIRAINRGLDFIFLDTVLSLSTIGGLSQRIKTYHDLCVRTSETLQVFTKNYGILWGVTYSVFFFFWNSRKILIANK